MKKHHAAIQRVSAGVKRFYEKSFTRVVLHGPTVERERLQDVPLLIACTHRSQADYFLLGQIMFDMGAYNMRFAAGENLTSLPWIGRRFREFGAFTVRRAKNLGKEYVRNLTEDVVAMLRDGDSIIVFPEGGRSYGGEMMEVRGGIVGAGVLAQVRDPGRDVCFLPMAISYEELPEVRYFDVLQYGRSLRRPGHALLTRTLGSLLYFGADAVAFTKFLFAHRLGIRYGAVYVDYGPPIPVRELVDLKRDLIPDARDDFAACRVAFQSLQLRLRDLFTTLYRVLPSHILAGVVRDEGACGHAHAAKACSALVKKLAAQGRNVLSVSGLSGQELVAQGKRQLEYARALRVSGDRISVARTWAVQYYAATTD
jgi:1-acyl-sn-glycerol-3-phosphate acyltransferase